MNNFALLLLIASPSSTPPVDIAVIGASASAGWGVVVERPPTAARIPIHHRHLDLAAAIGASLGSEHADVSRYVDALFFIQPLTTGAAEVTAAIQGDPDVVVGIDFLFWYAYGHVPAPQASRGEVTTRLALLQHGLRELERFDVPLLIGDLPDMSSAADIKPIAMLTASQVPSSQALAALNDQIAAWASERDNVTLLPLAATMESLRGGGGLAVDETPWPIDASYIQFDQLHPSVEGLLFLAAMVAARLDDGMEGVTAEVSPEQLRQRVNGMTSDPAP
ncbi:MAG: hypothetical protein QF561_01995 [Phycisphaerales bacterium]|jgi:hypothetical protein|nr:hypothetical protein [Phycisphaerales bacterium]